MDKSIVDVLLETRYVIADPNNWTCGNWVVSPETAKTWNAVPTQTRWWNEQENMYCLEGAMMLVMGYEIMVNSDGVDNGILSFDSSDCEALKRTAPYQFLLDHAKNTERLAPGDRELYEVNDGHEHAEVMAFLDEAIRVAKEL